jgi:zinc protease
MLKHCFIIILTLVLAFPAHAQTFGAESFTLQNGLQVVVIPNHRAPVVTHMIWYKVGAADEKPGASGMAHYLEHLLFKGTATMAPGDFSKTVKTLGGDDNAFTGQDYTAYFVSIAAEHLEGVMAMEADRMMNIDPPPAHYASEKSVVIEERRQRTDNDPRAIFAEQAHSALFINHPYGTPVIGWMKEIESYEWADVKKFYQTWYAPNNAVVVISGDVTMAQVRPMAERIYGTLMTKSIPPRVRPSVPPGNGNTVMTLRDASVQQPSFETLYIAPSERQNRADSLALQVLENILSGGAATRLYKSLVVEQKKAVSADMSYNASAYDNGTISLSGIPADGVTLEELRTLILSEIQKIITDGVTDTEVREAIQRLQDDAIFARDSVSGPAMIFGQALTTGSKIEDVENWPSDIAKVTPAQVKEAAIKYLNPAKPYIRPPVTAYMLPIEAAP